MQKRLREFDLMKGFGILFVVLGHIHIKSDVITCLIYGVHMPLFFFVSGWFFRKRPIREHLLNSLRQLIIPWAFFSTILFFTHWIINTVGFGNAREALVNTLCTIDFLDEQCWVLYSVIWFFIGMFWVRLFYVISSYFLKEKLLSLISWSLFAVGMILQYCEINLPLFLDSAFTALIFYHLGYQMSTKQWLSNIKLGLGFLALSVYILVLVLIVPYIDIFQNLYPVYVLPVSILGIIFLFTFCRWLDNNNNVLVTALDYLGQNSIVIFGLHGALLEMLDILLSKLAFPFYVSILIRFIILISLSLLIGSVIKRYCPILIGQKNGNNK